MFFVAPSLGLLQLRYAGFCMSKFVVQAFHIGFIGIERLRCLGNDVVEGLGSRPADLLIVTFPLI
jgi:hypothetical protein